MYAPDGIYCNGKYYLCACGADNFEAILESDSPSGPFVNAKEIIGASGDSIDPAIFVDDDGQVYYFWGQFRLKGAKLNTDMETLDITESVFISDRSGSVSGLESPMLRPLLL